MKTYKERSKELIAQCPQIRRKGLTAILNASLEELSEWIIIDQKELNKRWKGNLDKYKYDLIKIWSHSRFDTEP